MESWQWYTKIANELVKNSLKPLTGDPAIFFYRVNHKLEGIINLHGDDILAVGSEMFFKHVISKIKDKFKFSKIEKDTFRFCGNDIKFTKDGIILSQDDYINSIEELQVKRFEDQERPLTKSEFKQYRGATGKLSWATSQTRPDLGYDSLEMSYSNRDAKIKHMKAANKNIKKAKEFKSFIKFTKIGKLQDFKILTYSDASHLTIENKTKKCF